jgi:CheY-like chemotaxis protein
MPYTVLFVEDDADVRESTEAILAQAGFRLLVASDGTEAMRLLEHHNVDALFTDIAMPGMLGTELARKAKEQQPGIKIMLMTGYFSRAAEAERLGRLLFKPLRSKQLVAELHQLLAGSTPLSTETTTEYDVHFVDTAGNVYDALHLECETDETAVDEAHRLDVASIGKGFDIWDGMRLVHRHRRS